MYNIKASFVALFLYKFCLIFVLLAQSPFAKTDLLAQNVTQYKQSSERLTIYTEHFPPYNFIRDGQLTGINIELVRQVCEQADLDCNFVLLPWNRAMRNAKIAASSGLVSTARIPKRESLFHWVGPLSSGVNCIYKLSARDDIEVKNLDMARNYRLGISRDAVFLELLGDYGFTPNQNLILYPNKFGLLRPFAAKRIDLMVGSANSIASQLAHASLKQSDIEPVTTIDLSDVLGNYLAINKDTDPKIVERLQKALQTLLETNVMSELQAQFSSEPEINVPEGIDPALWKKCM